MIPFLDLAGARPAAELARARARALKGAGVGLAFGGQALPFLLPAAALFLTAETLVRVPVVCPRCGRDVGRWADTLARSEAVRLPDMEIWTACPACGWGPETHRELLAPVRVPPRKDGGDDAGAAAAGGPLTEPAIPLGAPEAALSPGALPWTPEMPATPPPAEWPSGHWWRGRVLPAGDEELRTVCDGAPPFAVWTPESGGWTPPERLPALWEAIRPGHVRRAARRAWGALGFAAGAAVAAAGLFALAAPARSVGFAAFLVGAALVYAAVDWNEARAARTATPEGFRGSVHADLHEGWIAGQEAPGTRALAWALVAIGFLQLTTGIGRSAALAGLLEPRVMAGEWWRVVTSGLVHGGYLHFLVNYLSLQALGRLLEVHAHRTLLPLVFLVSVATGSAAELAANDAFAVGASGGLLGIIGFLAVCSFRRADVLPHGFRRTLFTDLAAIAAVGLVGAAMIANAAHAGGLLGGALLGLLLVPSTARRPGIGWTPAAPVRALGWASAAALALAAAGTALLLLGGRAAV